MKKKEQRLGGEGRKEAVRLNDGGGDRSGDGGGMNEKFSESAPMEGGYIGDH